MRRRSFLVACGVASLNGCLGVFGSNEAARIGTVTCADGLTSESSNAPTDGTWPTSHADIQNTGYVPGNLSTSTCPSVQWTHRITGDTEIDQRVPCSPTVAEGTVYFPDARNKLYAVEFVSGEREWQMQIPAEPPHKPTYHEGRIYVAGGDVLAAIDPTAPEITWTRVSNPEESSVALPFDEVHTLFAAPSISENKLVVVGKDGLVWCVDRRDGQSKWAFTAILNIDPEERQEDFQDSFTHSPTIADGRVFVGRYDGTVFALDLETGEPVWQTEVPDEINHALVFAHDSLFVPTKRNVHELDPETGEEIWRLNGPGMVAEGPPAVGNGVLVVGRGESFEEFQLAAVDLSDHSIRWETPALVQKYSSPTHTDEVAVAYTPDYARCYDLQTGEELWRLRKASDGRGEPVVVDNAVFVADTDGYVFGLW